MNCQSRFSPVCTGTLDDSAECRGDEICTACADDALVWKGLQ